MGPVISVRTSGQVREIAIEEFERAVRAGEIHPNTEVKLPLLTGDRWVPAGRLDMFQRLYSPLEIYFARSFRFSQLPWVTLGLCAAVLLVHLWVARGRAVIPLEDLMAAGAKVHASITELGESWRLITANLLHRDFWHLGFNLLFLLNLGAAIENAYRRRDLGWILVASALSTTTVSALLSDKVSVGASGMVLGLFGAATVFGFRYAAVLPRRYRHYFGGAALPYALFIIYLGLVSPDTDNWGHVGGFVGGVAAALPLRAALLWRVESKARRLRAHASLAAALGLVVLALGVGDRLLGWGSGEARELVDGTGLQFVRPKRWQSGVNHFGDEAWGNVLGVTVGVAHFGDLDGRASTLLKRFEERVSQVSASGEVLELRFSHQRPRTIDGVEAKEVELWVDTRVGRMWSLALLAVRGRFGTALVWSVPEAWAPRYADRLARWRGSVRWGAPPRVQRLQRALAVFPGRSDLRLALARAWLELGAWDEAERIFASVEAAVPEHPEALIGLAELSLRRPEGTDAWAHWAEVLGKMGDRTPRGVSVYVDLLHRLGRSEEGCTYLQSALDTMAEPPPVLRARLSAWRCQVHGL